MKSNKSRIGKNVEIVDYELKSNYDIILAFEVF